MSVELREARPGDVKKMREFHDQQNKRDSTSYPLPQMFDESGGNMPHIPIALVVERNGDELIGSLYVETAPELCFAGCDPRATAIARQDIEALSWILRQHGFSHLRCLVPEVVVDNIRKPLEKAGFLERPDLRVFTRSLAPKKEDDDEPRSAEPDLRYSASAEQEEF